MLEDRWKRLAQQQAELQRDSLEAYRELLAEVTKVTPTGLFDGDVTKACLSSSRIWLNGLQSLAGFAAMYSSAVAAATGNATDLFDDAGTPGEQTLRPFGLPWPPATKEP